MPVAAMVAIIYTLDFNLIGGLRVVQGLKGGFRGFARYYSGNSS